MKNFIYIDDKMLLADISETLLYSGTTCRIGYICKAFILDGLEPFEGYKRVRFRGIDADFYYGDENTIIEVNTRKKPIDKSRYFAAQSINKPPILDEKTIKAAVSAPPKVNFEGQWYKCPYCKKALFLLHKGAIVRGVSYRCKACKHDIEVNI